MPITLQSFEHTNLCHGRIWTVVDEDLLAQQIACVALGQSRHAQKILAGANLAPPPTSESAAHGAIALLTVTGVDPWHRDGWMFQVMSWIAARLADPNAIIRYPHMILAHKGFDGLSLKVDEKTDKVVAAVIFEDKASDNPRTTIRDEVWPDFLQLEKGDRENVLVAEVTSLLETQRDIDPDSAIENVIWKSIRKYRVSITIGATHTNEAGRRRLFKNYDEVVEGDLDRRHGETFYVESLRPWMAILAGKAIAAVQTMVKPNV